MTTFRHAAGLRLGLHHRSAGSPLKTIFAIVATDTPATLAVAVEREYAADNLFLADGQWLVADQGTVQSVCAKLGITGTETTPIRSALVVAVSSYWGRKPPQVWEWIRTKWEEA